MNGTPRPPYSRSFCFLFKKVTCLGNCLPLGKYNSSSFIMLSSAIFAMLSVCLNANKMALNSETDNEESTRLAIIIIHTIYRQNSMSKVDEWLFIYIIDIIVSAVFVIDFYKVKIMLGFLIRLRKRMLVVAVIVGKFSMVHIFFIRTV